MACLGTNFNAGQPKNRRINATRTRLAAIDQVWPRLPYQILHGSCDDEGSTLRQEQAKDTTVELLQSVFELVHIFVALRLPPMREESVNNERVECNDQRRDRAPRLPKLGNGYSFMDSIGILEGIILKGEMLVKWSHDDVYD